FYPLPAWEWALFAATVGMAWVAAAVPRLVAVTAALLGMLVAMNSLWLAPSPYLGFYDGKALLYGKEGAFQFVKQRMTLQDRAYAYGKHPDYAIMPKSASMFDVRAID